MCAEIKKMRKPNLHRVLEFVSRTLPMIGYEVRHLCELLFEKSHSFVKTHFGQTGVGPNEAWNCLRKIRERELCERFLAAIHTKEIEGMLADERNNVFSSLNTDECDNMSMDRRFLTIVSRVQNSGARGLIVESRDVQWVTSGALTQVPSHNEEVFAEIMRDSIDSINDLLKEQNGSSIDEEEFYNCAGLKATVKSPTSRTRQ